ncbi:MAG TPA: hypothetical protein VFM37_16435, partial [Pseudonocardiaceae bacterium]|nr:hypothetical protein [Pseudonocardiaceae bacterium]
APGVTVRCDAGLARLGEEPGGLDRRFRLDVPQTYRFAGAALPRPGASAWTSPAGLAVSASSHLTGDPALAPRMLFDGDRGTSWVADLADRAPTVRLRWSGERSIDRIELERSDLPVTNPPLILTLAAGDEQRRVQLTAEQESASFEPLRTDKLDVVVQSADRLPLAPPGRFGASAGLAELRIPALRDLLPAAGAGSHRVTVPCGQGPPIEVDGTPYPTAVSGTRSALDGFAALTLTPCAELADGLALRAGEHRVRALPSEAFVVQDLALLPDRQAEAPAQPRAVTVHSWDSTHRRVEVGDGADAYLVVPENANPGWVAKIGGRELQRLRVDGWQQAWLIPAGTAGLVELDFAPDRQYRLGLLSGAIAVLVLLAGALVPVLRRRNRHRPPATPAAAGWWPAAITVLALLLLLGGPFPVIALLACLLLRHFWAHALPAVAAGAFVAATAVAVVGRVSGHGQDWAFGPWTQAAGFVAVSAVVAAFLYPSSAEAGMDAGTDAGRSGSAAGTPGRPAATS